VRFGYRALLDFLRLRLIEFGVCPRRDGELGVSWQCCR